MSTRRVLIFNRFERFWHWTQAAVILVLLFTRFGVHGLHLWATSRRWCRSTWSPRSI